MRFVIDSSQEEKIVELKLVDRGFGRIVLLAVHNNRNKTIMEFRDGCYKLTLSAKMDGIQTDEDGRIKEYQ